MQVITLLDFSYFVLQLKFQLIAIQFFQHCAFFFPLDLLYSDRMDKTYSLSHTHMRLNSNMAQASLS
jgi:hypothetical protein